MLVAGLSSWGGNYDFVGIIVGEEGDLASIHRAVHGAVTGVRSVRVGELSETDRESAARRLLEELDRRGGRIRVVSIRTGLPEAFTRARLHVPLAPVGAVKRACLSSLARLVLHLLLEYGVGEVYCDQELADLVGIAGLTPRVGGCPAELAGLVAWIGLKVDRGERGLVPAYRGLVEVMDFSEQLSSTVLRELE